MVVNRLPHACHPSTPCSRTVIFILLLQPLCEVLCAVGASQILSAHVMCTLPVQTRLTRCIVQLCGKACMRRSWITSAYRGNRPFWRHHTKEARICLWVGVNFICIDLCVYTCEFLPLAFVVSMFSCMCACVRVCMYACAFHVQPGHVFLQAYTSICCHTFSISGISHTVCHAEVSRIS